MKKTSPFQLVITGIFGAMVIAGIIFFMNQPKGNGNSQLAGIGGTVTIWGTFQHNPKLDQLIVDFNSQYQKSFAIKYEYKDPATFDTDIVEALASGKGPDILLLPDNLVLRHYDKIIPISYTPNFGQREYLNTFVQASDIYLRPEGMVAFPYAIDPIVMYWNRDLFTNASIAEPPKYWDEFLLLAPKLTKTDSSFKITQSAVAFGEYDNVKNAKDILAMLFLQTGSKIVDFTGSKPQVALTTLSNGAKNPGVESALRFFMDFSNPQKSIYTWSLSRDNSEQEFLNGDLAVYFDYASAYGRLKQRNPNLNFDVAMVPQLRDATAQTTLARLHGLVAMKASKNITTAFAAIRLLLDQKYAQQFADSFDLPPVRRDLLSKRPNNAAMAVAYDSALRSRTWLDPRPSETDAAFTSIIDGITSNRIGTGDAVGELESRLTSLVGQFQGI